MANTRLNSMTQQEEKNFFGSNPVLHNIEKSVGKDSGTEVASYKGITLKSLIFLAMILVGVVLASIIHSLNYQTIYLGEDIFATVPELIGSLVSAVLLSILSIVCIFLKKTIPFFGSLYCISFGYLYTSMANLFNGYREAILTCNRSNTFNLCSSSFRLYERQNQSHKQIQTRCYRSNRRIGNFFSSYCNRIFNSGFKRNLNIRSN